MLELTVFVIKEDRLHRISLTTTGYKGNSLVISTKGLKNVYMDNTGKLLIISQSKPKSISVENHLGNIDEFSLADYPICIVLTQDGTLIGMLCGNKLLTYRRSDFLLVDSIEINENTTSLCFSPCNHYIAYGALNGMVWLYDREHKEGRPLYKLEGPIKGIKFSDNGRKIVSFTENCFAQIDLFESTPHYTIPQIIFLLKAWQYSKEEILESDYFKKIYESFHLEQKKELENYLETCTQCSLCNDRRADCIFVCNHKCCKVCLLTWLAEKNATCMICRQLISGFTGPDRDYAVEHSFKVC